MTKVDWKAMFNAIKPQIEELMENGVEICAAETIRARIVITQFVADAMARNDLLMMKTPVGYHSCPICDIQVCCFLFFNKNKIQKKQGRIQQSLQMHDISA